MIAEIAHGRVMIPPFMQHISDPRLWFFIFIAAVWIARARLALETLRLTTVLDPCLKFSGGPAEFVSVILPAKNEERNIGACLRSLLAQDYPRFEILVINDNSEDQTENILKSIHDPRLSYLNAPPTPVGWTGKNFAIHHAVAKARGTWFLFTDADTRHESQSLTASIAYASQKDLPLLTLLPRCLTGSFFENLIQPSAMAFLGLWCPIQKANDPRSPVVLANGQYLLMRRSLYEKIGGHEKVRGEFLEDYAMMRAAKGFNARGECAFGTRLYGTRMYESLAAIWRGWRRIYLHAFQKNLRSLLAKFLSVMIFSVLPFALLPFLTAAAFQMPKAYGFLWGALIPILIFILATAWKTYGIVGAKRAYAFLHPVAALFIAMILLDAYGVAAGKRPTKWR